MLSDDEATIAKKFKRAVTDSDSDVRFDPASKPGVSNLLSILAACTNEKPEKLAHDYTRYGDLKTAVGEAVIAFLAPVRARHNELIDDPAFVFDVLANGARRATNIAEVTLKRAQDAMGFLAAAKS